MSTLNLNVDDTRYIQITNGCLTEGKAVYDTEGERREIAGVRGRFILRGLVGVDIGRLFPGGSQRVSKRSSHG